MTSPEKSLEKSRDFWQEEANHDKRQFMASFVIAATGISLVGAGIGTMINGDLTGGALEVAVGAGITVPAIRTGLEEVQDYADMTAKAAVRQSELDKLSTE